MRTSPANVPRTRSWAFPTAIFVLALAVFSQYGIHGRLGRDEAVLMYAGQRLAEGVPPYLSTVTLKGPLAQLVAGAGVVGARIAGWDDLLSVRVLFLAISALTAALLARLGELVWDSRRAGLFAALILCASSGYGGAAASGPDYKTVMLLFFVLALLQTAQKRWFVAGAAGALAFLTWQPSAIVPGVTLLLAACERPGRGRAVALAAAGIGLPVLAATCWFAAAGAFGELALRIFLLDLPFIKRDPASLAQHVSHPLGVIRATFGWWMLAATAVALGVLAARALRHLKAPSGRLEALLQDRGAVILLSLPPLLAWSFLDFQGAPDFFPLLPFVGLGCAGLLAGATGAVARSPVAVAGVTTIVATLVLLGALATARGVRNERLTGQRREAAELERRYGKGYRFVSIGQPFPLVLLHRVNPNPYLFIQHGTDTLIERKEPGGFAGWLAGLERGGPLVVLGGMMGGERRDVLRGWLASGFRRESIGSLRLFVREGAR